MSSLPSAKPVDDQDMDEGVSRVPAASIMQFEQYAPFSELARKLATIDSIGTVR